MSAVTQQQQQGPGARRVTLEQIAAVQTMIERCMQLYMAKDEVMACLKDQANIEPNFSQLVWQKLEEQNADFFRAYNLRVQLKNQVVTFNQMLQQQLQVLDVLQQNSWTAQQPIQAGGTQQSLMLPGTSMPLQSAPVPASNAAASASAAAAAAATAAGAAVSAAPSAVTTALEQEQFQQQFNHHLQQHVQRHLQQQLANGCPLPFGSQAAGMLLQALNGMPYQPFMPSPAAAAAAASSGGAGPALTQTHSQRTASTGTGGTTPMAAGAANSRGFPGSTTDMLAAWGLGSSPALAAAAAAASSMSAGDAAAGAASTPRAAPAASPAGSNQQQQQQQQQQEQLAAANASAAAAAATAQQAAAAYMQQAAAAAQAGALPGSSGMHLVSSCAMLDALPAAEQMQMQMATLPKPFSMSDLNALDIPGQIANDLGDLSGLPYPGDGDAGSSAAAAAAVNAAAAAGGADERQIMGGPAPDGGVQGPGMRDARGSGGGGGGGGGEGGQQQVAGMPTGFTVADLGQLDMVMDMLR